MHTTRSLVCALLASLALATAVHGQNLITNGDFETGTLTPWVATNDAQIGSGLYALYGTHSCAMATSAGGLHIAKISQEVPTTPGTTYYLALDIVGLESGSFSGYTISGVPGAGGSPDGSVILQAPFGPAHRTLIFHASTASTKIVIDMFGAASVVDNIRLIALPPNKNAGKYTGKAQTILSSAANSLSNKESIKLVARIATSGQIVLLEGGREFAAGILLPDGTLDIRLHGQRKVVTTTIRGTRIQFTINGAPNLLDEGGNELDAEMHTVYTLTRVR